MAYRTEPVDTRPMSTALMLSKTFARPILLRIVSFVHESSSETAGRAVGQMDYAELLEHQRYIARVITQHRRVLSTAKANEFKCQDIVLIYNCEYSLWEICRIVKRNELTAKCKFLYRTGSFRYDPLVPYHKLRMICPLNANVRVSVHTCRYIGIGVRNAGNTYYKFQCTGNCNVGWCGDGFEMGIHAQCQFDIRIAPLPLEGHIPCKHNVTAMLI